MTKSDFESLLEIRAEDLYQTKKRSLLNSISKFFHQNFEMNAHDCGNSLLVEIDVMVNKRIEERKPSIISKIKQDEMNKILQNLESVKFLFQGADDANN